MSRIVLPRLPVLMVDDEVHALQSSERMMASAGINHVIPCDDPRQAIGILSKQEVSLVMLDLFMPHVSGEQLLTTIVTAYPEVPVIVVTGANEIETAVRCMKEGAFDYMVKPVERSRLLSGVQRAIELRDLRHENEVMRERLLSDVVKCPEAFSNIVTNNPSMYLIFRYCESIAGSGWPVLITGETGVGKELLARAIHTLSGRTGAFVAVNAAGLDDNVFSDTLFGHVRGAYTGADTLRKGLIEQASAGTLFLDEIGDLAHESQVKLLRVLQEREYYPLGSDVAKRTDARIVCATNADLETHVASGRLRKDLYHRLKTHHIHLPPLRKRLDDIPILVDHFLEAASSTLGKKKPSPPKELFTLLAAYCFPGNVRELESMISDAVSNHESRVLSMSIFEARISQGEPCAPVSLDRPEAASPYAFFDRLPTLKESDVMLIAEAMRRADGNQTIAARLLGISRTGLNKRLNHSTENV